MATQSTTMPTARPNPAPYFIGGLVLTLGLALAAKYIAGFPGVQMLGPLVWAILLGMGWSAIFGAPVRTMGGVQFASKKLLRAGIILLGMRLNFADILAGGPRVLGIAAIDVAFGIFAVYMIARWMGIDRKLGMLTACGTGICGAAAVAAISPQVKANEEETAVSTAVIAVLGTLFTIAYTILYPVLGMSGGQYGLFAGATLHEIAHVIAAAGPGGAEAVQQAVLVKLARVALLVPVALFVGWWFTRGAAGNEKKSSAPIPWFIFGFLAVAGVNSTGLVPEGVAVQLTSLAYILMAMAMAGLGLTIHIGTFRRLGAKPFIAGLIGSVFLSVVGYILVNLWK